MEIEYLLTIIHATLTADFFRRNLLKGIESAGRGEHRIEEATGRLSR